MKKYASPDLYFERHSEEKKRHTLVSWVHLSAEGNRFLAAGLVDEIMARAPGLDGTSPERNRRDPSGPPTGGESP